LLLLSAATLVFEINLSRLFAVAQFYHFAFMIVSLALLGFGASGTFLAIFPRFGRQNPGRSITASALGAAASIWAAYLVTNHLHFDSFSIAWDRRQIGILAIHYLLLALPFFFSGLAVGLLLACLPGSAGIVYSVNLTGSALGCLGALGAPSLLGGEGTVILSSGLAALGGLVAAQPSGPASGDRGHYRWTLGLTGLVLFVNVAALGWQVIFSAPHPLLVLKLSPYKSLSYALQVPGAEILSQRWNAFSRLDLVSSPGIRSLPGISLRYLSLPPPEYGLLIDGDNLSPVVLPESDLSFTDYQLTTLAYKLRPAARTLVLEPKGGLDLLAAVHQGSTHIIAVEPNPLVVEAAAHIYTLPQIETIFGTGRSYLRRSRTQFDLILFSLTDSYHPVQSGAYSLAEDYRYTLEAFQDALRRLDRDGILVIPRWLQVPPSEFLRVFILAVTALEQDGLDPGERIAAIRSFNTGLLLVKKIPLTPAEIAAVRAYAAEQAFDLVYLPGIQAAETNRYNVLKESIYYQAFSGFLSASSRQAWLAAYPFEVSPPTDDRPFFGHYFKWAQAPQILAELGKSWQPFGGAGYFVLLILLVLAVGMAVMMIVLPLALMHKHSPLPGSALACFSYFGLLGLAFLLVEIPLIQRLILFLGHPAYAFTTALFSLLLFSGFGSQSIHRISHRGSLGVLVILILIVPWGLPWLFDLTLGYPFPTRVMLSVFALAPLGFLMGVPFPHGIRKLEQAAPDLIPWAWAANGALSVVASILAALIGLSLGFQRALLLGALCYAIARAIVPSLDSRVIANELKQSPPNKQSR
jgi:hypothetical protein